MEPTRTAALHASTDQENGYPRTTSNHMGSHDQLPDETPDLNEQAAVEMLQGVLIEGERIQHYAIQRRLFALFGRRDLIAATNNRLIIIRRGLLGGFTMEDFRWQDIQDSQIRNGIFGADISFDSKNGGGLVNGLRKEQAGALYRYAQTEEQSWREKSRIRAMEEMRARAGGINISAPTPGAASAKDPMERLAQAKKMFEGGLLSDAEYEAIKAKIVTEL